MLTPIKARSCTAAVAQPQSCIQWPIASDEKDPKHSRDIHEKEAIRTCICTATTPTEKLVGRRRSVQPETPCFPNAEIVHLRLRASRALPAIVRPRITRSVTLTFR